MPIFFILITGFFLLAQTYMLWRLHAAFGAGPWLYAAIAWFCAMLVCMVSRRAQVQGIFGELLVWAACLWMGFILICLTCFLLADLLYLGMILISRITGCSLHSLLPPSRYVPAMLALSLALCGYAYYEALAIRTVHIAIPSGKLSPGAKPIRLGVMTDIHLGVIIRKERLQRMTAVLKKENPDIFLLAGDIIDTRPGYREEDALLLRAAAPAGGAFAVLGNHEFYSGLRNSLAFFQKAGVTVLRNQSADIGPITLVGADDPMFEGQANGARLEKLLREMDPARFTVFLNHRPGAYAETAGLFDLQISGHTHGGQIWPAGMITFMVHKRQQGLSRIAGNYGNSLLYLSNGTGFWGPPMRLFTPPEVTIIDIVPAQSRQPDPS